MSARRHVTLDSSQAVFLQVCQYRGVVEEARYRKIAEDFQTREERREDGPKKRDQQGTIVKTLSGRPCLCRFRLSSVAGTKMGT